MKKLIAFILFLCVPIYPYAEEIDISYPDLSGQWIENENFPGGGILVITQNGPQIEGRYLKVGDKERNEFNYEKDELVLTGIIRGDKIEGHILLKEHYKLLEYCEEIKPSFWSRINLDLSDAFNRMQGEWPQHTTDFHTCEIVNRGMQKYSLKRMK